MAIRLGGTSIGKLYLGSTEITKAYLGSTQVYSSAVPVVGMTIRRSSDNAEEDINDDASGYIDETELTTHTGANSGFVTSWRDDSGNGNHAIQGTHVSQPRVVNAGTVDEGVVFDGSNDFLTLTTPLSFAGEFTLACWAKRSSTSTYDAFFGNAIGIGDSWDYFILWNNSTQATFSVNNSGNAVNHGVDTTQWNHFAATRDSGNVIKLYVNGVFVANFFSGAATPGNVDINLVGDGRSLWFHGHLDEVYAANVALSEAEIAALMNGTEPASGTVLWLKFKDQTP